MSQYSLKFGHPIKCLQRSSKFVTPRSHQKRVQYIIATINYFTKWVEAKATPKSDSRTKTWFLYEYVFTRYELPIELVSDEETRFINKLVQCLLEEFMILHKKSSPYHPQANGQAKTKKNYFV